MAVLGICNFDTKRLKEIIDNGINVATNQVQVSCAAGEGLQATDMGSEGERGGRS